MSHENTPQGAAQPRASEPERIVLPDWIDEAKTWLTATERLATALAREDGQIAGELRQVRGLRKPVDAVLERIEAPDSGRGS